MSRALESRVRRLEQTQADDLIAIGPFPPVQPEVIYLSRRDLPRLLAGVAPTLGPPALRPGYGRSLEMEPETAMDP